MFLPVVLVLGIVSGFVVKDRVEKAKAARYRELVAELRGKLAEVARAINRHGGAR